MWSLVLKSRKPEAKRFKKWITSEVIPSIRKTGSYNINPAQVMANVLADPGNAGNLFLEFITLQEENALLTNVLRKCMIFKQKNLTNDCFSDYYTGFSSRFFVFYIYLNH